MSGRRQATLLLLGSSVLGSSLLGAVLLAGSAAAQDRAAERFTTGPPPTIERDVSAGPGSGSLPPASPPDGNDIRANQTLTNLQNETSISVNPLDPQNWVGTANDFRTGTVQIGWYTTLDGGQTWTDGVFKIVPGYSFAGDPCVVFDDAGVVHILGMQYFSGAGSAVWHYRSADGGQTWTDGNKVAGPDQSYDKPQVGTDLSLSAYRGDITVAWLAFRSPTDIEASTSSDGGLTWSAAQRIDDSTSRNAISSDVTYGPQGEVYVMWADRGSDDIWVDKSTDGGATWGTDVLVAPYNAVPSPIPGSSFRMFDIFSMAADWTTGPHSGNVYVAYHTWNKNTQNSNIRCSVSTDGGATWADKIIHSDPTLADQVMPGMFVDPNGNVNVSYYDRRLDPANYLLWTWISRSSDGGVTWSDYQVSDVGWDHRTTGSSGFIGDYTDCDGGSGFALPFWCDGRDRDQDVYTDQVNLDLFTDVDTLSAATGGQVTFTINAGPNRAGESYWLLGSLSDTPGITFPNGVHLPLSWDGFFLVTMKLANSSVFPNSRGVLDATGSATAMMNAAGPLDPALAGLDLYFATLVTNGPPTYASLPTKVTIVP